MWLQRRIISMNVKQDYIALTVILSNNHISETLINQSQIAICSNKISEVVRVKSASISVP